MASLLYIVHKEYKKLYVFSAKHRHIITLSYYMPVELKDNIPQSLTDFTLLFHLLLLAVYK